MILNHELELLKVKSCKNTQFDNCLVKCLYKTEKETLPKCFSEIKNLIKYRGCKTFSIIQPFRKIDNMLCIIIQFK